MDEYKILIKIMNSYNNVKFDDLARVINKYGFIWQRTRGSHNIYVNNNIKEIINIQNVNGKAKPYQVKQVLKLIEKYNLEMED